MRIAVRIYSTCTPTRDPKVPSRRDVESALPFYVVPFSASGSARAARLRTAQVKYL